MARIKTLDKQDCNGETFAIIQGKILTNHGYKDIEELQEGNFIVNERGRFCKVKGIKKSYLLDKKALQLKDTIFTADMLFLTKKVYGSFDVEACYKAIFKDVRTNRALGHFDRFSKGGIYDLSKSVTAKVPSLPMATPIYTLIVQGARWCIVDGMTMACAKEIRGFRVKED